MEIAKIPPQSLDLEEIVLGSILLESNSFNNIADFMRAECFYKDSHRIIFDVIYSLFSKGKSIDTLIVAQELKKLKQLENIGGAGYLARLSKNVASSAHIVDHARIVYQMFLKREVIRISSEALNNSYDENIDPSDLIDQISSEIIKITQSITSDKEIKISKSISEVMATIEKVSTGEIKFTGISTGKSKLDRITFGWQKSDLIILAARPSMGKTALALDFAKNASMTVPTAFFSLEMSHTQLSLRLIASESSYSQSDLKAGKVVNWKSLDDNVRIFDDMPLYVDDTPALKITQFRAKLRTMILKYGIQIVFVDYLQLMRHDIKGNREQEVSFISSTLKACAKEYNIPIVALAQLNRAVESRGGSKRPQLSDLRESGSIEQDADIVMFINRPAKYGVLAYEDGKSTEGIAEVIIEKHRNGALGEVLLHHDIGITKFTDEVETTDPFNSNAHIEPMHPNDKF